MTVSRDDLAEVIRQVSVEQGDDIDDADIYAEAILGFFDCNGLAVVDRERYEAMERALIDLHDYADLDLDYGEANPGLWVRVEDALAAVGAQETGDA